MTRTWSFLKGGPRQGRFLRYILVLAAGWIVIGVLAVMFLTLSPKTYSSGFTLILPGAGSGASVNLDSLGQATTNTASPFGSHSLSPTENYKRLLQSYRLRGRVAGELDLPLSEVPAPSIKLANQTKLMYVSVKADDPDMAHKLAETWLIAFNQELEALRLEEQNLREMAYRETLAGFEETVRQTQAKIIAFQTKHGLIPVEQFRELVGQTETLRIELERAEAERLVALSEVKRLSAILGVSAEQAVDILALLSDGAFQAMIEAQSKAITTRSELNDMFGPNHPDVIAATQELSGLSAGIFDRGRILVGFEAFAESYRAYYTSHSELSALLPHWVSSTAHVSDV